MRKVYLKKGTAVALFIIIALALVLRFSFVLYKLHDFKIGGDARNYLLMSRQLVDDGIYGYWYDGLPYGGSPGISNARVTPTYPLFLSSVYAIFNDPYRQITAVRIIQALTGGIISPLLAFLLMRKLSGRDDGAVIAAFFVAIYPSYIYSTTQILTEVISLATMLLYFYFTALGFKEKKTYAHLLAGGAFAVQILVRPAMLPLFVIPFIYGWFTWFKRDRRAVVKIFVLSVIGFTVVMLPWWVRNYVTLNRVVLTAEAAGNPLLSGTYPYMRDVAKDAPDSIKGNSDLQTEFAKKRIIEGFTTQPLLYFKWYTVGKIQFMFKLPWLPGISTLRMHDVFIHYFILALGVIGGAAAFVRSVTGRVVVIYAVLFLGLYLMFVPENRYAYQLIFFLIMGASYLLCLMRDVIGKRLLGKT
ncbi:dolichyl-phosphate-mannose-protein mannosyltransferase [Anaerobacterium chartisolvens]|uniref:Dolichyl-phosphate-mannose-protein mannosyltransferase n=1 Tax=Anaerobacterium chartisolvens TaxID=1297424 RepID=A0A369ASZ7_9FIRM|nr:glycosyltransferase family 39 protein [Anaerobacterium chartisolvens]RCX12361.1 dolichyl-phosphate-mannose-protein mannosyltransferase [Anaerobacterium chartisolvens]